MNKAVQITAVLVVLLAFVFMIFAPSFGLDLHMSPILRGAGIGLAVVLMFMMGISHQSKTPRLLKVNAHR